MSLPPFIFKLPHPEEETNFCHLLRSEWLPECFLALFGSQFKSCLWPLLLPVSLTCPKCREGDTSCSILGGREGPLVCGCHQPRRSLQRSGCVPVHLVSVAFRLQVG